MSELLRAALGLTAALAPFGALPVYLAIARKSDGKSMVTERIALTGAAAAFAILCLAALIADPFLDFLDVSSEPFRFAAGAAMAPLAMRLLLTGDSMPAPRAEDEVGRLPWLLPVAFPLLAGPVAIVAAISYSARFGEGTALGAAAIAAAISGLVLAGGPLLQRTLRPAGINALGRLSGGLLIVIAVVLAIDGVRSV